MIPDYVINRYAARQGLGYYAAARELGHKGGTVRAARAAAERERKRAEERAFERMRAARPDLY